MAKKVSKRDSDAAIMLAVSSLMETKIAENGYVTPFDVLIGLNAFDSKAIEEWSRGEFEVLEDRALCPLKRISSILLAMRNKAKDEGWKHSMRLMDYREKRLKLSLRYSKSDSDDIDRWYETSFYDPYIIREKGILI